MRFWWLSDCNCSVPLRARACCGVRKSYSRPGLATSERVVPGRSQTKKASQKWQNNMNAQEAVSLKNIKEQALMQSLMQQSGSVQPIRKVEM